MTTPATMAYISATATMPRTIETTRNTTAAPVMLVLGSGRVTGVGLLLIPPESEWRYSDYLWSQVYRGTGRKVSLSIILPLHRLFLPPTFSIFANTQTASRTSVGIDRSISLITAVRRSWDASVFCKEKGLPDRRRAPAKSLSSLQRDVGRLYDAGPQGILLGERFSEFLRRTDLDVRAEHRAWRASTRRSDSAQCRVEPVRCPPGFRPAPPRQARTARSASDSLPLPSSAHPATSRSARPWSRQSAARYRTEFAGARWCSDRGDLDLAGKKGCKHRRRAAVGNMHDVRAGFELEQFKQQMRPGAEALNPRL